MKVTKQYVHTCSVAAALRGSGTQVYYRPDNLPQRGPLSDKDPAVVLHESEPEDTVSAIAALERSVKLANGRADYDEVAALVVIIIAQRSTLKAQQARLVV